MGAYTGGLIVRGARSVFVGHVMENQKVDQNEQEQAPNFVEHTSQLASTAPYGSNSPF